MSNLKYFTQSKNLCKIERMFIFDMNFFFRLMDDLKTQIFQLSESLACDNVKRIPYSINKLFNENAAIRDELDLINLYMTNKKDNSSIIK